MKRSPAKKTVKKAVKASPKPLKKVKITKRKILREPAGALLLKSRFLQLSHRKHTAKLLPHRSTSYPLLALLLLLTGLSLVSLPSGIARADITSGSGAYDVNLSVPGLPPTEAAVITAPNDGQVFTTSPITIKGTCPLNTYVKVFRNDIFSGVGICDADGLFQIQSDLFSGANQLIAKVYSVTDLEGPASTPVTVSYKPPVTSPATSSPSSTLSSGHGGLQQPLLIGYTFTYKGVYAGEASGYTLHLSGGTAPYAVQVNWGDGAHDLYSLGSAGALTVSHVYKAPGSFHGAYTITVSASDAARNHASLQLLAIITQPEGAATTGIPPTVGGSGGPSWQQRLPNLLWPVYGGAVLAAACFWLGEVHELRKLVPRRRHVRHV